MLNVCPKITGYKSNVISFRGGYTPVKKPAKSIEEKEYALPTSQNLEAYYLPKQKILIETNEIEKTRPNLLSHADINYREWLDQFETKEDEDLALKMLKNFVYIDIDNARKAFRKIYSDLSKEIDIEKTNFATLGTAKSGSFMGYLFRQANKLRSKGMVIHEFTQKDQLPKNGKFITSTQLETPEFNKAQKEQGKENIVIVDDILGDGDSFTEYLTPEVIESLKQYKKIYYVTLIKDPDGEKRITDNYPDLNIQFKTAQEVHKYDSPHNKNFTDLEKFKIKKMLDKYGYKIDPKSVEKYSRSKLFVTFDWNTPGNTPMIFNLTTPNWKGIFQRYNGLEAQDVGTDFDFYN